MHLHLLSALSRHRVDIVGFVGAFVLGCVFLWLITPPGHIQGLSGYWQTQLDDMAQYLSGYRAYISSPWSFPLLSVPTLNWPQGTVLTFLDAVPGYSLAVKAIGLVLPIPHNPLGFWVLVCYGLQGAAAWFLMRQVAGRNYLLVLFGVALCIMMPVLSSRMAHISLQAHFVLLTALGLYFRQRSLGRRQVAAWSMLLLVAFYTNLYLTAMAVAVMVGAAADEARRARQWSSLVYYLIPLAVVLVSVPVMLGTAFGSAVPDTGFGVYSMNLLAPVAQGHLLQMPFYEQREGQYEGYNYLGLGLILLVAFAAWRTGTTVQRGGAPRIGPFLITALVLCSVYALSNEIYLGRLHLLRWEVPCALVPLFEAFRSSGRFFWVVAYALAVLGVRSLAELPSRQQILAVLALLAIQVTDLAPTYSFIKQSLEREPNILADIPQWNAALEGVETIHAFPKFKCPGGYAREVLPLQMVAAEGGYNLTTGFISRYGAECDAVSEEIAGSNPATSAYVFAHTHYTEEQIQSYLPTQAQCRKLEIWTVCRLPE